MKVNPPGPDAAMLPVAPGAAPDAVIVIFGAAVRPDGAPSETLRNRVEAAARSAFDLILMDVQMPVMDGVDATRAIRRLAAPAGETPIIAMTANVFTHQQDAYREAGMTGSVSKPLSPARLLVEINRIAGPDDARGDTAAAVA